MENSVRKLSQVCRRKFVEILLYTFYVQFPVHDALAIDLIITFLSMLTPELIMCRHMRSWCSNLQKNSCSGKQFFFNLREIGFPTYCPSSVSFKQWPTPWSIKRWPPVFCRLDFAFSMAMSRMGCCKGGGWWRRQRCFLLMVLLWGNSGAKWVKIALPQNCCYFWCSH